MVAQSLHATLMSFGFHLLFISDRSDWTLQAKTPKPTLSLACAAVAAVLLPLPMLLLSLAVL